MAEGSYNQFCPVAMAAEILCTRWTVLLMRELTAGSTRFNELRRGVPRMSPALLVKRLRDLEAAGIITRARLKGESEIYEYRLTAAGRDLQPVIEAMGRWGQRWIESETSLQKLDPNLLMWDMRRNLDTRPMPRGRSTIQFIYTEQPQARRDWWLVVEPEKAVDLCSVDPGFEVDLYVTTELRTMTEIWMGLETVARARDDGRLHLTGSRELEASLQAWLGLSPFAKEKKLVA
jgi:DNA-binding HxlR family transcriptional regulator